MSCIVYQTDKRTGIKYAYESVSYWDKDKKQPKSKRKYLGRVDPQTEEILTSRRKKTMLQPVDRTAVTHTIQPLHSCLLRGFFLKIPYTEKR